MVAPRKPDFTFPYNGSGITPNDNVIAGVFHHPAPGIDMASYALRRRPMTPTIGAYTYWNGTTWTTISWVATAVGPEEAFTDDNIDGFTAGVTYQLALATKDENGEAGPFCQDIVVVCSALPEVDLTAPTGVQDLSRPYVTWVYDTDNVDTQLAYEIVLFTAAQYGAGGFDPDVALAAGGYAWYSGYKVDSEAWRVPIGTDLDNGVTYRVYLRVTSSVGQVSTWEVSGDISLNPDPPPAPTVVVTPVPALGVFMIDARSSFNLLSDEDVDLTTMGSWEATAQAELTQPVSGELLVTVQGASFAFMDSVSTTFADAQADYPTFADSIAVREDN